jgi:hypothetical protein
MKPSRVVLGDMDDYVEIDDRPDVSLFHKVFCCLCLLFEPKASVVRLRKKVVIFDPLTDEEAIKTSAEVAVALAQELKRRRSAIKIQALVRGRIGRKLARLKYSEAIAEIDKYWRDILQAKLDAKARERRRIEARKRVS